MPPLVTREDVTVLSPRCGPNPGGATEPAPRTCLDSKGKPASDNPIVLWDGNPVRCQKIKSALNGLREIDSPNHLETLTSCGKCRGSSLAQKCRGLRCPKRFPSLVLFPFEGPDPEDTVVEGLESWTTVLLRFIKSFAQRVPILVYSDITHLPISLFSAFGFGGAADPQ